MYPIAFFFQYCLLCPVSCYLIFWLLSTSSSAIDCGENTHTMTSSTDALSPSVPRLHCYSERKQWKKTHCGPASFPLPTTGDPGMGSSSNQSGLKDFSQSSCSVEWISAVDEWLSARLTRKQWQRICSSKRKDSRGDFISVHVQDSAKFLPLGPVSHPLGLGISALYFLNKLK